MSILDKFKSERHIVGVSLTPGIGLEAVVLEKSKRQVAKYARRDVQYNFSTREIQNMAQFKAKFAELMEELSIPLKAEINVEHSKCVYFSMRIMNSSVVISGILLE